MIFRFSDSDLDMDLRNKNNRPKRTRGAQNDNNRKGRSRGAAQTANDDIKNSPSAAAKRRNKVNMLSRDLLKNILYLRHVYI